MFRRLGIFAKCSRIAVLILFASLGLIRTNASAYTAQELATMKAYREVAPSVVNITTNLCEPGYFYCAVPSMKGIGSGVVLRPDGLIITNYHVVYGARDIEVTVSDRRRFKAGIIASDPGDDLSVIKVDPGRKPLKAIRLGDSHALQIGQRVLALGNPFGLGETLTAGVVSMTGRTVRDKGNVYRDLIQTDATINPGNSGGALVDLSGRLVGICTAIVSPNGASIRIGFATPVSRVRKVAPGLMDPRRRSAAWIPFVLLVFLVLRMLNSRRRRVVG
ncbi:MAG: S1C family serine protease [Syntrophobacteraceae bacterium]